jgi:hypothetical protein
MAVCRNQCPAALTGRSSVWHTLLEKGGIAMTEPQKEAVAGVLSTGLVVGILLGGLLVLKLVVH